MANIEPDEARRLFLILKEYEDELDEKEEKELAKLQEKIGQKITEERDLAFERLDELEERIKILEERQLTGARYKLCEICYGEGQTYFTRASAVIGEPMPCVHCRSKGFIVF